MDGFFIMYIVGILMILAAFFVKLHIGKSFTTWDLFSGIIVMFIPIVNLAVGLALLILELASCVEWDKIIIRGKRNG